MKNLRKTAKLLSCLALCLCLVMGSIQPTKASTGLSVWDEFAQSFEQNSKLPSSFGEVLDWAKDRFTDVKGVVGGIVYSTDRKGYRDDELPEDIPVINARIKGIWGDERSFVKVADVSDSKPRSNSITLKKGRTYEVSIYYVNDCPYQIFAEDVELFIDMPKTVKKKKPAQITAAISASNTEPKMIYDGVKLKSKETLKLKYVKNSMQIESESSQTNGKKLNAANAFDINKRVRLGSDGKLDGTLMAGEMNAGKVTFRFKATK